MTEIDDFIKAKDTILHYLAIEQGQTNPPSSFTETYPSAKKQTKGLLRFPGTNTWLVKNEKIYNIKCTNRTSDIFLLVKQIQKNIPMS